jgi:hypothetical protein
MVAFYLPTTHVTLSQDLNVYKSSVFFREIFLFELFTSESILMLSRNQETKFLMLMRCQHKMCKNFTAFLSFSETEVSPGTRFTITCDVSGAEQPHKVTLTKPDNSVLTWLKDR